jgi:hypothetical protein
MNNDGAGYSVKKQFFLPTQILTDDMKDVLEKTFVQSRQKHIPQVKDMVQNEWKQIFSQENKNPTGSLQAGRFREMCIACENKSKLMFLVKAKFQTYNQT